MNKSIFEEPYANEVALVPLHPTRALIEKYTQLAFALNLEILVLDFETYYGQGHTLSAKGMTYDGYCFSPQFQPIMCGFISVSAKLKASSYGVLNGAKELNAKLIDAHARRAVVVAHNMFFDAMVIYRLVSAEVRALLPTLKWACTQMMSKQFHPHQRHSLAAMAKHYGLPDKGHEVVNAKDKRREDFTQAEMNAYTQYCWHDAALCLALFVEMYPRMTSKQRFLIAWHMWMYVGPQLVLNVPRLRVYDAKLQEEHKQRLLELAEYIATDAEYERWQRLPDGALEAAKIEYVEAELNSTERFAGILRWLGIKPPMKVSKKTGKQSYAFNKTTKEFTDLLDHEDDLVATVVAARLGVKSSILRTRTRRLIEMGERVQSRTGTPWFMVSISYYGALTGRGSGTNKCNPQNFTRGSEIRNCIIAPEGYKVVVADSSNIEMRIAHLFTGQMDTIQRVRNGEDLYCWFAGTHVYDVDLKKVSKPKSEWTKEDKLADEMRFVGKVAMLSLQYGAGPDAFMRMLWAQGRMRRDLDFCSTVVHTFRSVHKVLRNFTTKHLEFVLEQMCNRATGEFRNIPYATYDVCEHDGDTPVLNFYDKKGARMAQLRYPNLRYDNTLGFLYGEMKQGYWEEVFDETNGDSWYKFVSSKEGDWWPTQRIYNGGLLENICQFLANLVLTDVLFTVYQRYKIYAAMQVHDELVYVVKAEEAEAFAQALQKEMCAPLHWWPELPLGAETKIGLSYGDAK